MSGARPPWRIRYQIFWATVFCRLAGPGRDVADRYEINDELAELHFELAESFRCRGQLIEAARAERRAVAYNLLGTPPDPRPAGALAMPLPPEYRKTSVNGGKNQWEGPLSPGPEGAA